MDVLAASLLALAIVGTLDSLYFVLVRYRLIAPDPRWLPAVCRMDERSCATVVHTRYGHVFWLPNAVYGLAWFLLVGGAALWALATGRGVPLCEPLLAVSALTVLVSAYLAWALIWKLRTPCPLCFLGHGTSVATLALLAVACG